MNKKTKTALRLALLPVMLVIMMGGLSCASRQQPELGMVDMKLKPCPDKNNCVSSEKQGAKYVEPLSFKGSPADAWPALLKVLKDQGADILKDEKPYLHSTFTTRIMRFVDDVEFRLDPEAKVIHVRSASRVGRSDLGTNRRRVERIRKAFTAQLSLSSE